MRIFHSQQLALEGNELMNMHRLILINDASDMGLPGEASRAGMAQSCDRRLVHKGFS